MLSPSTYPRFRNPSRSSSKVTVGAGDGKGDRMPMVGAVLPPCCASTPSGAASTAPRPVTNARRFTRASRLHLRLCLLQPVRHPHLAVHRRRGGEVLFRLLALARVRQLPLQRTRGRPLTDLRTCALSVVGTLCRQWTKPAGVAFAATAGVLAPAQYRWPSSDGLGTETPSAH